MISINLLPKTLRKRVEPGWWRLIAIAVPVVILGVVLGLQIGLNNQILAMTEQKDQLTITVKDLQRFVDGNTALLAQQKELEVTTAIKAQLEQSRVKWSKQINTFVSKIPRSISRPNIPAVSLKSFTVKHLDATATQAKMASGAYDKKAISTEFDLVGEAESQADINRYVKAFEEDPKFGIEVKSFSRSTIGGAQGTQTSTRYSFNATVGVVSDTPVVLAPPPTTPTTPPPTSFQNPTPAGGANAR